MTYKLVVTEHAHELLDKLVCYLLYRIKNEQAAEQDAAGHACEEYIAAGSEEWILVICSSCISLATCAAKIYPVAHAFGKTAYGLLFCVDQTGFYKKRLDPFPGNAVKLRKQCQIIPDSQALIQAEIVHHYAGSRRGNRLRYHAFIRF